MSTNFRAITNGFELAQEFSVRLRYTSGFFGGWGYKCSAAWCEVEYGATLSKERAQQEAKEHLNAKHSLTSAVHFNGNSIDVKRRITVRVIDEDGDWGYDCSCGDTKFRYRRKSSALLGAEKHLNTHF